ncbi:hypothetical protein I79_003265 [Cricetulus griseus]|uniref:Uncharacterized protein n=1 Tax=Cricetulus griseus TaxID=10029 RepID=G3GZJ3_CRIGR|nr:hypothetical protein I79_003265 [Cricetulus griseus]
MKHRMASKSWQPSYFSVQRAGLLGVSHYPWLSSASYSRNAHISNISHSILNMPVILRSRIM